MDELKSQLEKYSNYLLKNHSKQYKIHQKKNFLI